MVSLRKLIGLAGVAKNENYLAQKWGRRFEFAMVLIAIWLPLQWHMQKHQQILPELAQIANWCVWLFFVAESVTITLLVQHRLHYLKRNWLNIVIIIFGVPWIWQLTPLVGIVRGLQLLLMARLLLPWWNTSVLFLSRNRLGTTLITALVTTTLAGVLMSVIDPVFKSPWTGIWWAWETVTTVGYGDNVPISFAGRLLAVVVMLMGIALISLLTANFSAYFISKGTSEVAHTEEQILKTLQEVQKRLDKIEENLRNK